MFRMEKSEISIHIKDLCLVKTISAHLQVLWNHGLVGPAASGALLLLQNKVSLKTPV